MCVVWRRCKLLFISYKFALKSLKYQIEFVSSAAGALPLQYPVQLGQSECLLEFSNFDIDVFQHSPFSALEARVVTFYKEKVLVGTWKAPSLNIEHIVRHQSQYWRSLMFIEFPWHRPETATRKWSWRHCLLLDSLDTLPATPLIVWHGGGHRMVSGNTATARTNLLISPSIQDLLRRAATTNNTLPCGSSAPPFRLYSC